jgi:hypothetical protein
LKVIPKLKKVNKKKHRGVLFYKRARCIAADPKNIGDALCDRMILCGVAPHGSVETR